MEGRDGPPTTSHRRIVDKRKLATYRIALVVKRFDPREIRRRSRDWLISRGDAAGRSPMVSTT